MNHQIKSIVEKLKSELVDLYKDRLENLFLFGSHARNQADNESDIDVLVVLKDETDPNVERERTIEIVSDLSLENNVVIACIFMGVEEYVAKNNSLLRNINQEGISI